MPTARGWLVALCGFLLINVGRVLGAGPVEQVGVALMVLSAAAVVVVRLGRHELGVERRVDPVRSTPETPVSVSLQITNEGRRTAPLMLLEDRLPPGAGQSARFALKGLESNGRRSASYDLRPARRGLYRIGPLSVSFVDPFYLASVHLEARGTTDLLVHPRIERLALPRDIGEQRSLATSTLRMPTGATGEDFYTLRPFVEGDDLRKIHWPSTAKRAKAMIRQEETTWQTRATILLDDRTEAYDPGRAGPSTGAGAAAFERAVEAAASLVDLYYRSRYTYRLVGAHSSGPPPGTGVESFHRCLDLLATVQPSSSPGVDRIAARLAALESEPTPEGTLVVITGTPSAQLAAAAARCRRRFRQVVCIAFPAHRFGAAPTKVRWERERITMEAVRVMTRSGVRSLVSGPDESLGPAWASLSSSRSAPLTDLDGSQSDGRGDGWAPRPELV